MNLLTSAATRRGKTRLICRDSGADPFQFGLCNSELVRRVAQAHVGNEDIGHGFRAGRKRIRGFGSGLSVSGLKKRLVGRR